LISKQSDDESEDVSSNKSQVSDESGSEYEADERGDEQDERGEGRREVSKTKRWTKSSRSRKRVKKEASGEEPEHWRDVWDAIETMRKRTPAPVDSMGCHTLADRKESPETIRYQLLIGLMLSSQTKDPITAQAMENLRNHGLTVDNILETDDSTLDKLICKVGFHNRKTKYIKQTSKILKEEYNGDIPRNVEDLMKLPGVGPKMALLLMQEAWNDSVGIGVDVHVHRISNRLGWVHQTNTPEETRNELESWLPRERWTTINKLLVGFGQTICTPINPKCDQCLVSSLCPSAFKSSKGKTKKK